MGLRNYSAFSDDDWRMATANLGLLVRNRWPVYVDCDLCELRLRADLERMVQLIGPKASLWGMKPRCRRVGCPGRVTFYVETPGPRGLIAMTAKR